ncbi:MAG: hypothetical protein ACLQU9_03470 [Acidimicrobiales bacterium]|jgi:hypothetical protein
MGATRDDLHRIAAHVLGRRRSAVSGHFGLRSSPDGVATPAYGPEPEVLRLAGAFLVREVGTQCRSMPLDGATVAELARFAGADLGADFSAGPATPPLGSVDVPLRLDAAELDGLFHWFDLGWRVLDAVTSDAAAPGRATVQLWPEHFDAATALDLGAGAGVNLGFSGGDAFCEEPYAYVGPWGPERPGDPAYWNAPFGAFVPRARAGDVADCAAFLRSGLTLLAGG